MIAPLEELELAFEDFFGINIDEASAIGKLGKEFAKRSMKMYHPWRILQC